MGPSPTGSTRARLATGHPRSGETRGRFSTSSVRRGCSLSALESSVVLRLDFQFFALREKVPPGQCGCAGTCHTCPRRPRLRPPPSPRAPNSTDSSACSSRGQRSEGTRTRRGRGWLPSAAPGQSPPRPRLPSVQGSRGPGLSATSLQPLLGRHGRFLRPPSHPNTNPIRTHRTTSAEDAVPAPRAPAVRSWMYLWGPPVTPLPGPAARGRSRSAGCHTARRLAATLHGRAVFPACGEEPEARGQPASGRPAGRRRTEEAAGRGLPGLTAPLRRPQPWPSPPSGHTSRDDPHRDLPVCRAGSGHGEDLRPHMLSCVT